LSINFVYRPHQRVHVYRSATYFRSSRRRYGFPKRSWGPGGLANGDGSVTAPTNMHLPHVLPCQIWSFRVKGTYGYSPPLPRKMAPQVPRAFQGHSMWSEPDRSATYDFLLVICSNYRPTDADFGQTSKSCPHALSCVTPPSKGQWWAL